MLDGLLSDPAPEPDSSEGNEFVQFLIHIIEYLTCCNYATEGAAKVGNRGGEELEADEAGEVVHQGAAAAALPNSEAGEDRGRVHTIFDALFDFFQSSFILFRWFEAVVKMFRYTKRPKCC